MWDVQERDGYFEFGTVQRPKYPLKEREMIMLVMMKMMMMLMITFDLFINLGFRILA
jgi:hypothetical protein